MKISAFTETKNIKILIKLQKRSIS